MSVRNVVEEEVQNAVRAVHSGQSPSQPVPFFVLVVG